MDDAYKPSRKAGTTPGTVSYVGTEREELVEVRVINYDAQTFHEETVKNVAALRPYKDSPAITWIDITGVHNETLIREVGELFSIHPLTLEDIANTTQRPKVDEYEAYLFFGLKLPHYDQSARVIAVEQVSLVLGDSFVLSFQEKQDAVLDPLRSWIRQGKGKIRQSGSDYLAYAIIDAIVDHYFVILEQFDEDVTEIEEELMAEARPQTLNTIYKLKRELIFLHKSIWPMREVVSSLQHGGYKLIKESLTPYLRDVYDHTIQAVETIETFRDTISGMLDLYLSSVSNKMNEIMKVLTVFAAIFIPLTFIAGVYGMNFRYMPELAWRWGYFGVLGIMLGVVLIMLVYFRRKNWF